MQFLLFAAVLFLGMQLIFNSQPKTESRPSNEILKTMREQNQKILDVSIPRTFQTLERKVDEEVGKKMLTADEGKKLKMEGRILVANTQFRAGVLRNEFGRMNSAYHTLQGTARAMATDEVWLNHSVEVPAHPRFADEKTYTGKDLYAKVVSSLSERSKTDLIMGFVPGYQVIDVLVKATGAVPVYSYALAAFLLALLVRAIIFPLAQKQYLYGREMAQLSPLIGELRERYTDKKTKQVTNPQELQMKTMELYREYGINPFAGCWPALIQVPFFLLIYQCMLHYQFDFQKGLFLWINPGTSAATNGFIAPNLGERDYILIGLYAISMVVTTLMTPVSDPNNAKQQRLIGVSVAVLFSVMMFFYPLPSAFVLYWVFLNILATAHMLYAYRMPVPPLQKVATPTGGVFPGFGGFNPAASNKNGSTAPTVGHKTGTPVRHRPKKKK